MITFEKILKENTQENAAALKENVFIIGSLVLLALGVWYFFLRKDSGKANEGIHS
jgi:hypothetical protein